MELTEDQLTPSEDQDNAAPGAILTTNEDTTQDDVEPKVTDGDSNEVTAETDDDDEAVFEAAIQARLKVDEARRRLELEETVRRELEARQAREAQLAAQAAEADKLRNSFVDAVRDSYTKFQGITVTDEDGKEVTLSDDVFEQVVVAPFQRHNANVQQAVQSELLQAIGRTALDVLPADVRDAFAEEAKAQPLDKWLRTFAEKYAPSTQFAKGITLEQIAEANPVIRDELEAVKKAAEARGLARARKAPAATPPRTAERAAAPNTSNIDMSTQTGLAAALRTGLITEFEYVTKRRELGG